MSKTDEPNCGCRDSYEDNLSLMQGDCLYPAAVARNEKLEAELRDAREIIKGLMWASAWPHGPVHQRAEEFLLEHPAHV